MKHLGLFEGIGGFSLAARWMGWETVAWCEWNEFCQKVLKYHFPDAEGHSDITKTDFTKYKNAIDIITGGFPCQPYSVAGKRKGTEDDRHLWPEMLRAIREVKPRWVVGENVPGLVNWSGGLVFEQVQTDLEAQGYEVVPVLLPACAVNAPHRRDRIWFIAYNSNAGIESERQERENTIHGFEITTNTRHPKPQGRIQIEEGQQSGRGRKARNKPTPSSSPEFITNASDKGLQGRTVNRSVKEVGKKREQQFVGPVPSAWEIFPTQPPLHNGNDGLSGKLDGITFPKWRNESIKAGGNAIVPQVAHQIFKAIEQYESMKPESG